MQAEYISSAKLQNGEVISLGAIEITTIPHISIIGEERALPEIIEKYIK